MAKKGMKRPGEAPKKKTAPVPPMPELERDSGRAQEESNVFLPGTNLFFPGMTPIPPSFPGFFTDLGRDNEGNDLPSADLQDL